MSLPVRVAIAVGSNLGNRREHVEWAFARLQAWLTDARVSSIRETEPVGVPDPQPPYLNAAVVGTTTAAAEEVLAHLQALEAARGRARPAPLAPRTIDLDLILYGTDVIDRPGLVVPHPRFRERRFVLEPLAELVPDWRDPITGRTVGELLAGQK